jgi:superfamily II DNA/RNA helicase
MNADPVAVQKFRDEKSISVIRGENIPNPISVFFPGCFPDFIMDEMAKQGFRNPTPIQAQATDILIPKRLVL